MTGHPRSQAGFTLIEISVVLFIFGLMLVIVLPRLPDLTATRAEAGADRLATLISYLSDEAALRGRTYRIDFDLERESWDIRVHVPYAEGELAGGFAEDWDPYAKPGVLPLGVEIASVRTETAEQNAGQAQVYLTPEGGGLPISITLVSGEDSYVVTYDSFTGQTSVKHHSPEWRAR